MIRFRQMVSRRSVTLMVLTGLMALYTLLAAWQHKHFRCARTPGTAASLELPPFQDGGAAARPRLLRVQEPREDDGGGDDDSDDPDPQVWINSELPPCVEQRMAVTSRFHVSASGAGLLALASVWSLGLDYRTARRRRRRRARKVRPE